MQSPAILVTSEKETGVVRRRTTRPARSRRAVEFVRAVHSGETFGERGEI